MKEPEFGYARAADGAYIGYEVIGDGPIDLVWQVDWPGNIDMERDSDLGRAWLEELSTFGRVILHDRRGVGLSSRNVELPNLETTASDLLTVLDAVGAERPVLTGIFSTGATNILLAATRPERVRAVVWIEPTPRFAWAPDYPWGRTRADLDAEFEVLDRWGTLDYGRDLIADENARGNPLPDTDAVWFAKASRNACTPDVARGLSEIWYETDVRGVLAAVSVPMLFLFKPGAEVAAQNEYVASLAPQAEVRHIPGGTWTVEDMEAGAKEVRAFVGAPPRSADLDTVLSTVLFTDIVDSTARQAALGDHRWKDVVQRHHAVVRDALERWHGVENDTAGDGFYATFDGPARAVRCALEVTERVRGLDVEVRAGVHTGECELIDGKHGGLTVSIGARVASQAGPSAVLVSQTVKDLTAGSGFTFEDAGEHELKGVPDVWRLYRVAG